jgi:hypothetical protein
MFDGYLSQVVALRACPGLLNFAPSALKQKGRSPDLKEPT